LLDVLINLLDDEFGFHEVGVVKFLTVDPLQSVVRQCGHECSLGLFFFDCCPVNRVDVRRDEEDNPFELPRFEVVPVLLEVKLRSLANNF
jgi:hypothetical protein